jgi:outer membrane cobalamin receptor
MKFLVWVFMLIAMPVQAAELVGVVTDAETGKPLQGVTVRVVAGVAMQTDEKGVFRFLNVSEEIHHLRVSHVGYESVVRVVGASDLVSEVVVALVPRAIALDELFVEAEPVGAHDVHQNPSFVTVITRESFEGRETSLPDVLAEATGVQVKRLGGLGAFSTISLRGSSAEQVEVYLDGVLLNAAMGGGVDLSHLSLAHVGQIEVYRGAGAAGNGLGGTVHIRTRASERHFSHSVRGAWGDFGTRSLNGMVTGGSDKAKFLLVADYTASDNDFGFLDDNGTEYNVNDDVFTNRQNNVYRSVNVLGKWHAALGDGRNLTIQESVFWKSQGIPGISNNQSQRAHLGVIRSLTEVVFQDGNLLPGLLMRHSVYFTHVGESFADPEGEVGVGRQDNDYQTRTSGWQGRLQMLSLHPLTATVGILRETYVPTSRLQSITRSFDSQRWTFSGRVGADWSLPAGMGVVSTGIDMRRQRSSFTGANPFSFSPLAPDSANTRNLVGLRLGLRVNVMDDLILKANVGRTLRAPSFYELFGDRGGVVGNVDLRPEGGLTWDAGIRYATDSTILEGAFFDHRYEDLIQFVHTSQATSRPVNIGKARVWGVEVTAQKTILKRLDVSGNYTYQRALDQSDIPHLQGKTLPNRPAHTLFARVKSGVNRVTIFYDYTFEDGNFLDQSNRRPLASRHIHNVGMKVDVRKGVQLGLEAKNLKNAQIADTWGYPLPGRAFFVNLQEHF